LASLAWIQRFGHACCERVMICVRSELAALSFVKNDDHVP